MGTLLPKFAGPLAGVPAWEPLLAAPTGRAISLPIALALGSASCAQAGHLAPVSQHSDVEAVSFLVFLIGKV